MNLLAAAGAPGSPVRKVVLKSSGLVYGANKADPVLLPRGHVAHRARRRTPVERSLLEVEAFVRDFADDNPHVDVTLLRFANVLGDDIDTPFTAALRRPVVPEILGFDRRALGMILSGMPGFDRQLARDPQSVQRPHPGTDRPGPVRGSRSVGGRTPLWWTQLL